MTKIYQDRPYQIKFKPKLAKRLAAKQAIIACAATGSGKSKMMADVATGFLKTDTCVLITTESIKIFDQLKTELPVIIIAEGVKHVEIATGKIYLAMVQTLVRRAKIVEQFEALPEKKFLVMNDEAHIGTATKLLLRLKPKSYLIGWTATPNYPDAKFLPVVYEDCVQCCQVEDLIQAGFLCTFRCIARDKNVDLNILELRSGEYSEKSNEKAFGTNPIYEGLIEDLHANPFNKAMIFVASIKQAELTYQKLLEAGFKVCRYHSGNKEFPLKNPDYELAKFTETNQCDVCVSVRSLTKGFDYPPIDLVAKLMKTNSLALDSQINGRASRPVLEHDLHKYPFMSEPKTKFTVLDYGGNFKQHGLYWDDRDWETLWLPPKNKRKKSEGVAPVKICTNCDCIVAVQAKVCPECGFSFPEIKGEPEIGEAIEVTKSYTDLIGKSIGELTPLELSVYAKIKQRSKAAIKVALFLENEKKGYLKEFGRNMGYGANWHHTIYSQVTQTTGYNNLILR